MSPGPLLSRPLQPVPRGRRSWSGCRRFSSVRAGLLRPFIATDGAWYLVATTASLISTFVFRPQLSKLAMPGVAEPIDGAPCPCTEGGARRRRLRLRRLRRPRRDPPLGPALVGAQGPSLEPPARRARDDAAPTCSSTCSATFPRKRALFALGMPASTVATSAADLRGLRPARTQQSAHRRTMARAGLRHTPAPSAPPPPGHSRRTTSAPSSPSGIGSSAGSSRATRARGADRRSRRDRRIPAAVPGRLPPADEGGSGSATGPTRARRDESALGE